MRFKLPEKKICMFCKEEIYMGCFVETKSGKKIYYCFLCQLKIHNTSYLRSSHSRVGRKIKNKKNEN